MSVKIPEAVQQKLADTLHSIEETSELTRCVVVTRTGIKVAPDMDADSYSASSAALIDLGERVVASLEHGTLEELVINAIGGYVILVAIGKEYMLLGATPAAMKMGYYLPFIRKKAWELESIIYGTQLSPAAMESHAIEAKRTREADLAAASQPEPIVAAPKISQDVIKAADMKAMNDVLAAFDEFGINDEFAKSLGNEATPAVSISKEEMSEISKQISTEKESMPNLSTAISAPAAAPTKQQDATKPAQAAKAGEYPIPLEPGEVPPIPLSVEELNPFAGAEAPAQQPVPVMQELPTPEPSPPVAQSIQARSAPLEKSPSQQQAPAPQPASASPATPGTPVFESVSEYDFDFDPTKQPEKEVVIPEQDSMSDTLKALGWEEEEDKQ